MQTYRQSLGQVRAFTAFGWAAARTSRGTTKAVGTGEHAGRTEYGKKAAALLSSAGRKKAVPAAVPPSRTPAAYKAGFAGVADGTRKNPQVDLAAAAAPAAANPKFVPKRAGAVPQSDAAAAVVRKVGQLYADLRDWGQADDKVKRHINGIGQEVPRPGQTLPNRVPYTRVVEALQGVEKLPKPILLHVLAALLGKPAADPVSTAMSAPKLAETIRLLVGLVYKTTHNVRQ